MKSNILTSLHLIAFVVSASLSGQALAFDKVKKSDVNKKPAHIETTVKKADSALTMQNGVAKKAKTLHKGQKVLGGVNDGNVYLTGEIVVKFKNDTDYMNFADEYDLKMVMSMASNLVIFEPNTNAELSQLLDKIKSDTRVVRAKLDKTTSKNMIQ